MIPSPVWLDDCDDLKELLATWRNGKFSSEKFQEKSGILFRKGRIVLSTADDFRFKALWNLHDSPLGGHLGYVKMLNKVRAVF